MNSRPSMRTMTPSEARAELDAAGLTREDLLDQMATMAALLSGWEPSLATQGVGVLGAEVLVLQKCLQAERRYSKYAERQYAAVSTNSMAGDTAEGQIARLRAAYGQRHDKGSP